MHGSSQGVTFAGMKIFQGISAFQNVKNPILTLGMYDGVHIGHQTIIRKLNEIAAETGGESTLLTFEPHPRLVLNNGNTDLELLTPLDEKMGLLEKYGLQNLVLHPFTREFSQLSSDEFVRELLCRQMKIHSIVIGYDHHFGRNREGNFEQLSNLSKELDFNLIKLDEVKSEGAHISSTQIRNALLEGNVNFAQKGLGRHYSVSGKVIHGDKLGRTLGFPTANLQLPEFKLIPRDGVYMVRVHLKNQKYKGLLSIGNRPTVTSSDEKRVEVFILDFEQEIYDETLTLELLEFIRKDMKFKSIEELIKQMSSDKDYAESFEI